LDRQKPEDCPGILAHKVYTCKAEHMSNPWQDWAQEGKEGAISQKTA